MKKVLFAAALLLPSLSSAQDRDPLIDQLEGECGARQICGDEAVFCVISRIHELRESGAIPVEQAFRLLKYAELKLAFLRGFREGQGDKAQVFRHGFEAGLQVCGIKPRDEQPGQPGEQPPGDSGGKVELCHKRPKGNPHTIRVSENAVDAHLKHGDTLGACTGDEGDSEKDSGGSEKDKKKEKGRDKEKGKDKERSSKKPKQSSKK